MANLRHLRCMLSSRHIATAFAGLLCIASLRAQTVVSWANAAADFSSGAAWIGGVAPTTTGSFSNPNIAELGTVGTIAFQPTLNTNFTVDKLRIAAGAASFTLSGSGTLNLGVVGLDNQSTAPQTIAVPIRFNTTAPGITNAGTLTISGAITNDVAPLGLTITNNGTLTLSGNFANNAPQGVYLNGTGTSGAISGPISGTGSVTIGQSSWNFSGANTYTGGTIIKGGTLQLGATTGLPTGGNVTITPLANTSGTLDVNGKSVTIGSSTLGGDAAGSATLNIGSGGTLTLGGDVTYVATNNPAVASIAGGTLALGGNRIFDVGHSTANSSGDVTISSAITGAGANLTKKGSGKLVLSGVNTYGGTTIVNDGRLQIATGGTHPSGGNIVVNELTSGQTAAFDLGGTAQTIGTLTFIGAANSTNLVDLGPGGTLTLGGDVLVDTSNNPAGASITNGSTLQLGASARTFTVGDSSNATVDLRVFPAISGTVGVTKTGAGTLLFGGANDYSGATAINAGKLIVTGTSTGTGLVTVASGATLQFGDGGTGGMVAANIVNNGNVVFARSDSGTYAGVISGTGGLTVGTGSTYSTMTLTGANTYTGLTKINSGTLAIGSAGALPSTASIYLGNSGTLNVTNNQTIREILDSSSGSSHITIAGGKKLTIAPAAGATGVYVGTIDGDGALELAGGAGSTLTLGEPYHYNYYNGGTIVSGGTLLIGYSSGNEGIAIIQGPVGLGSLTLQAGTGLGIAKNGRESLALANPIFTASDVTFSGGRSDARLNLSGTVSVPTGVSTLHIGNVVVFRGAIQPLSGTSALTFDSASGNFGHALLLGSNANVTSITANNAAVIFGSQTAVPTSGLTIQTPTLGYGYFGIGAVQSYTTPSVSSVLGLITNKSTFSGTIGFDTDPDTVPHTFSFLAAPLDLSAFGAGLTLGSATGAVLTGTIIPAANGYAFGNGGGALVLDTVLGGSQDVTVNSLSSIPNNALTTIFRGNNTFTGNLALTNSLAILDAASALPAGRRVVLGANAYVGYTENFTGVTNFADFVTNRVVPGGYTSTSIIGVDSAAYITSKLAGGSSGTRTFSDTIDLSNLGPVSLGTTTRVTLTGPIFAPNQSGANRKLSLIGANDGALVIASPLLSGRVSQVAVGSTTASFAEGTVVLAGSNTYTGGTTLLSGTLLVDGGSKLSGSTIVAGPLGTGTLTVPVGAIKPVFGGIEDSTAMLQNPIAVAGALQIGLPYSTGGMYMSSFTFLNGIITDLDGTHPGSLDVYSYTALNAANTFTGGVTFHEGMLTLGNDAALGTGTFTLMPGVDSYMSYMSLMTMNGPRTIANNLVYNGADGEWIHFNGSMTFNGSFTVNKNVTLAPSGAPIYFNGPVTGAGGLTSSGSQAIVLTGANTYSGGTVAQMGAVIFGSASSIPASPAVNALLAGYSGYIGVAFVPSNLQATFLDRFDKLSTVGAIGFDSPLAGPTNTFAGAIDLTGFDPSARLSSATQAILTGAITPQGSSYNFGSGGGLLEVNSGLTNGASARSLSVNSSSQAPLTLRLGGTNSYSGGTSVIGSGLIFKAGAMPATGSIIGSSHSYIGTEDTSMAPATFIDRFPAATQQTIIGFDSFGALAYTVNAAIDLSRFSSSSDPQIYIGTATTATIAAGATLTLPSAQTTYRFAGYKGGQLTVDTVLGGTRAVQIGDGSNGATFASPTDAAGPMSRVVLNGDNTYSGGTTLFAGELLVGRNSALGSGPLTIGPINYTLLSGRSSDPVLGAAAATDPITATPISLSNAIVLKSNLALGGANSFILSGSISADAASYTLRKQGSGTVTLAGANTFAGGVYVEQGTLRVTNASGLGTGPLGFSGSLPATAQIDISAVVNGISADTSSALISLANGTTLTVNQKEKGTYAGRFSSPGASLVFTGPVSDPTLLRLSGDSTGFVGSTSIDEGVVVVAANNAAFGASADTVTLNGGKLAVDAGVTFSNALTLTSGKLGGSGTIAPPAPLTINGGEVPVILAPAMGTPATLHFDGTLLGTTAVLNLANGGEYEWHLMDATNASGGWDCVAVTGHVAVTSSTGGFTFKIVPVDFEGGLLGSLPANFNPNNAYAWTVVTANSIAFTPGAIQINSDALSSFTAGGMFSLSLNGTGTSLILNFSPVPEPSTYALLLAGLGATALLRRRRRR